MWKTIWRDERQEATGETTKSAARVQFLVAVSEKELTSLRAMLKWRLAFRVRLRSTLPSTAQRR